MVPNSARPFVVRTQNAIVRVLGTHFSVRQYSGESESQIVVVDGRVALRRRRTEVPLSEVSLRNAQRGHDAVLTARMLAQVSDSGIAVMSGIALREYMEWTNGTLVFNHIPLRDVATELSRAYGVPIRIADSALASRKIVTEVRVTADPLPIVLDIIAATMDAHCVRKDSTYVLLSGRLEHEVPSRPRQGEHFLQPEKTYGR
jgi:ferric-dicitrate binding protein FerR (iron transport regulator)